MMDHQCNPIPRGGERNVFCDFYSACLDSVIERSWMTWNCSRCEHRFTQAAMPEGELRVNHSIAYYEISLKMQV